MSAWDCGVQWHQNVLTGPTEEPLDFQAVLDDHLRSPNVDAEAAYVEGLIAAAREEAESCTFRAIPSQTCALVLDRFPAYQIVLPRPPLIAVSSVTYVDADGNTQTLSTSRYTVVAPSGPKAAHGSLWPAYAEAWPATRRQPDAVTVTYTAGYGAAADVPSAIKQGMLLWIGELYKQRSESVHAFNQNPALVRARTLWQRYRAY